MKRLIQIMMLLAPIFLVAQTSNVVLPQDKGPDKIDVSAYPAAQQANYKLFAGKCSKCHTIARPMNTMMKRDEWERYVKRMMHKPNSGINDNQGKQIFDFMVYDQTERKDKPEGVLPGVERRGNREAEEAVAVNGKLPC